MESLLFELICRILHRNQSLLSIAISQRAKFEGWLKFELAAELKKLYKDTRVEEPVKGFHIDIHSNQSLIELKTPNTSYKTKGCDDRICTITDNINGIISDINKLSAIVPGLYNNGYIAFVMFPIGNNDRYSVHINKIQESLGSSPVTYQWLEVVAGFKTYVFVAKVF